MFLLAGNTGDDPGARSSPASGNANSQSRHSAATEARSARAKDLKSSAWEQRRGAGTAAER